MRHLWAGEDAVERGPCDIMIRIRNDVSRRGTEDVDAIRTTVTLPTDLVDAADRAVRAGKARSRNELLVTALRHELAAQRRAEIDADLAAMATDVELQAEAEQIEREFALADDEARRLATTES